MRSATAPRPTWRRNSSPAKRSRPPATSTALGLVLYEVFAGKRAFEAETLDGSAEAGGRLGAPQPGHAGQGDRPRHRARYSALPGPGPAPAAGLRAGGGRRSTRRRSAGRGAGRRRDAFAGHGRRIGRQRRAAALGRHGAAGRRHRGSGRRRPAGFKSEPVREDPFRELRGSDQCQGARDRPPAWLHRARPWGGERFRLHLRVLAVRPEARPFSGPLVPRRRRPAGPGAFLVSPEPALLRSRL